MSDTPRTDAAVQVYYDTGQSFAVVEPELSRQLERELNEARELARELRDALVSIEEYWNRDQNETAMADACWHAVNTAEEALTKAKEVLEP